MTKTYKVVFQSSYNLLFLNDMKININFFIILLFAINVFSQNNGENKLGAWYMFSGNHRISDNFSIITGSQIREYETTHNFNQLLLLSGLNYDINQNITAAIGYGFLNTDSTFEELPVEIYSKENRLFEQISLKNTLWKLQLEHRYRLEHRFLDSGNNTDTQHRTRYRLQVSLPITDIFSLSVYEEIFLNLQNDIFSQNRLFAALGIKVTPNSKVQLGYLKNHFNSVAFDRLQIGISIRTDLRNHKASHLVKNSSENYTKITADTE